MEVNIEQIMDGIRAEIKEKGYTSDMLSFKDVMSKNSSFENTLSDSELTDAIDTADSLCLVPFDRPLTGNPIAVLFKKIIRKLIRFYIRPIVELQNEFNAQIVSATKAVGKRAIEGKSATADSGLTAKVVLLEQKLEAATKENEELRQRLERLEQAITESGK